MSSIKVYNTYSEYLVKRFGEKVYKLPISLPLTCPNRDGCVGTGGCTFCGEEEALRKSINRLSIGTSSLKIRNISARGIKKFIAYFQNFSNTYVPLSFKDNIRQAIIDDIGAFPYPLGPIVLGMII